MSKQTDTPIYEIVKRERARHAAPPAPTDPSSIQSVGGKIEPAPDVRWFGLPWLRSGRG